MSLTATTRLTIADTAGNGDAATVEFGTALDAGKMRFDMNLATAANQALKTGFPQMGIRRIMFIGYPEQPLRVVFPDLKSFIELPLAGVGDVKEQADLAASRLEKKLVGAENIGGVATKKFQLHAPGSADRAYVWEAPGLNNLPVRLLTESGGKSYTFSFSNIRPGQIDPRVFGIPATFKKSGGFQDILSLGIARLTEQMNKVLAPK